MPPELLVNTADPMASLMIKKLDGTQSCGTVMPQARFPGTTTADDACIRAWALELAMGTAIGP
jgi:hypothetical protein